MTQIKVSWGNKADHGREVPEWTEEADIATVQLAEPRCEVFVVEKEEEEKGGQQLSEFDP